MACISYKRAGEIIWKILIKQKVAAGFITEKYLFGLWNSFISLMYATSLLYHGTQNHIPEATFLNFSSSVKDQDMIFF